jgi:molybdopterin molybdotransferase
MDGYAVRCADVPAAGVRLPVASASPPAASATPLAPGTAARIFTGAPLPAGADAVVMQELCEHAGDGVVINHRAAPGEAIRRAGEDIAAAPKCCRRHAPDTAAGHRRSPPRSGWRGCRCWPPPARGGVLTGDELVMPGEPLPPGGIYNSNRYTLRALLEGARLRGRDLGIVPDTPRGDARRAARAAAGQRPDPHQRRRLGGRGGPRQGGGRGGRRARPVEDRHQAGQAAGLRQSRRGDTPSSACRATRCRAS